MTIRQEAMGVVIVTYNRSEVMLQALKHVQLQTLQPSVIVVVNNASTDNTTEVLKQEAEKDSRVKEVISADNIGYGGGLTLGINYLVEHENVDYIWMMDDDSMPHREALELLSDNMNRSEYDLLGLSGYNYNWGNKLKVEAPKDTPAPAEFVLIDNALLKIDAVKKLGGPSADYFMMCEDYEFCKRLNRGGYKVGVIANNHVERLHLGSQLFSKATLWRGYYHSRNHLIILKQYFSWKGLVHYLIVQIKFLLGALKAPDRWKRIRFRLIGVYHGILSIKGKTLRPDTLTFIKKAH